MNKKLILLIDDDATVCSVLKQVLGSRDLEVVTAGDGNEGLRCIERRKPDLIILDLKMPGMSGVGFLNHISDSQGKPKYPVLVYSAHANMREFLSTTAVAGFLLKPCSNTVLFSEVDRILAIRTGDSSAEKKTETKRKILLADDDSLVTSILQRHLEDAGYAVETVTNGSDLIGKAITWGPDAIVAKEILPHLNGDAVVGVLDGIPKTSALPVILYDDTGYIQTHRDVLMRRKNVAALIRTSDSSDVIAAVRQLFARLSSEQV